MRRSPAFWLLLSAVLVCDLAGHPSLAADPSSDYFRGRRALERGQYPAAAAAFRAALKADPKEGVQKLRTSGVLFEDYFPHYYLGLCLEKSGDLEAAEAALAESEQQGAVLQVPELRNSLQATLSKLRQRPAVLAPPSPAPAATPAPVTHSSELPHPTATPRTQADPTPVEPGPSPRPLLLSTPTTEPKATAGDGAGGVRIGIQLYFSGNFDAAISQLRPRAAAVPAARLFLAFSIAARVLLSASADPSEAGRARTEYRTALAAGARVLRRETISPRILDLLEERTEKGQP